VTELEKATSRIAITSVSLTRSLFSTMHEWIGGPYEVGWTSFCQVAEFDPIKWEWTCATTSLSLSVLAYMASLSACSRLPVWLLFLHVCVCLYGFSFCLSVSACDGSSLCLSVSACDGSSPPVRPCLPATFHEASTLLQKKLNHGKFQIPLLPYLSIIPIKR
jgi:hypothetical protein